MPKEYSIAAARHNLAAIVKELDEQPVIHISRRNKTVAVLLSLQEYCRLAQGRAGFFTEYTNFRSVVDLAQLAIEPEIFTGERSKEPGRSVDL